MSATGSARAFCAARADREKSHPRKARPAARDSAPQSFAAPGHARRAVLALERLAAAIAPPGSSFVDEHHLAGAPRQGLESERFPEPAKRSRQRAPAREKLQPVERKVSRTRSGVGRSPGESGKCTRRPRHPPPMMRKELRLPGTGFWDLGTVTPLMISATAAPGNPVAPELVLLSFGS